MHKPSFFSESWFQVAAVRAVLRPGLKVSRQSFRGRSWYVVHDPVSLKNHRLTPEAWSLMARLDGVSSIDMAWNQAVEELGDRAPGQAEVVEMLGKLHAADLLRSDQTPGLDGLLELRRKQHKPLWLKNLSSPLSVRMPLWDCDAFLERITPFVRPIFGGLGVAAWLAWVLPAFWLAFQHERELAGNLSDQLLAPDNLLLLVVVFPFVKFFHELAHGIAVKINGGVVHEMGLMFLVLAPVPYVDASAASAIRSKWHRAFVGAAGMWAELALAAGAMYLWLLLEPGTLRSVMHSVILIAGISTVVFNGNPLLRFDGYYVLCDLIEIPNLGGRSNNWWLAWMRRHVLGDRHAEPEPALAGERAWLVGYAPVALVYRLFVTIGIALFIAQQYFFIGVALAVLAVFMTVVLPCLRGLHYVVSNAALARSRWRAMSGVTLVLATAFGALFLVPLPVWVTAEGLLWVPACAELRVSEGGRVAHVLPGNSRVAVAGTPVVRMENVELETEREVHLARIRQLDVQYQMDLRGDRGKAAITRDEMEAEARALARVVQRLAGLEITSCVAGEVQLARADDLAGSYLSRGELVGFVRTASLRVVRVVIPQEDIGLVREALPHARVLIVDDLGQELSARFVRDVPGGEFRLPAAALGSAGGGWHATDPSDEEHLRTLNRVFQLDLELDQPVSDSRVGARAYAKFRAPAEPAMAQLGRRVRQLFLSRFHV